MAFSLGEVWGILYTTDPTLTHVPPLRLLSINTVFAPYQPEALLAAPEPPLPARYQSGGEGRNIVAGRSCSPPPMTMKSYCLVTGAIVDNRLEMLINGEEGSAGEKAHSCGGEDMKGFMCRIGDDEAKAAKAD